MYMYIHGGGLDEDTEDDPREEEEERPKSRTVPYDRLQKVIAHRKRLEDKLGETQSELGSLRKQVRSLETQAGDTTELRDQLVDLQKQLKAATDGRVQDAALAKMGIFDTELAGFEHGRSGHEGTLLEWIDELKGKPEEAPAALRAAIEAMATDDTDTDTDTDADEEKPKPKRRRGTSETNRGTNNNNPPTQSSSPTRQALMAAKKKGQETGDWTEYRRLRGINPVQ